MATRFDFDIGVIGGGAAGLTVAAGAARLGARTLLVEKAPALGGDCLHYGCVPSKTLIHTAKVRHLMGRAAEFGLPPVASSPVDFRRVAERIRSVIGAIQRHDSVERFCGLGVRVVFGAPRFRDDHAVEVGGRVHTAARWVVATGSSAAVPPVPGLDRTPYLTNRELFDLPELPGAMVILGGGPIAVEMAQAFQRLGTRVTVVQRSGEILSKEDPDLAGMVREILAAEGVRFLLGAKVEAVREAGGRREVVVRAGDGEGPRVLAADAVLVALGRRPNVEGLDLEAAGVRYGPKGIHVDPRLRTTRPHIFAAGDCIGGYQFTHAAGYEGGIVVSNAVFRLPRKVDYTYMPWCTYTDPELASIGLNEKRAQAAGIRYSVWSEDFEANDRSLAEGCRHGRIKLLLDEKERPIGLQILGPRAGDLLGEWAAFFNGKVKLATLAAAVHPYPTLAEINKRVAGDVLASKIFSGKVRKGLRFFFGLKGRACGPPEM
ncbi:FAD-dependent oxidoreductase [Dissulfurirhabdus thermomarina]|uniref:FAD-dependent oxidoreductase n=1 Tax=Dissulfurirhabdus thermomarina TaxID=1765737 RepID=A0A6N9TQV5_DISTH|nr:FAD-dependent oxidoreductase [Dissulfurirhabdus thermomarina]NDY42830.1 FAD-dependent oxidoreductase [Dissulfurirhabdus thermomarina]NMX23625.1 FAD-dependent oxidoreductase [Dissulfurirhabdus thermomarina]